MHLKCDPLGPTVTSRFELELTLTYTSLVTTTNYLFSPKNFPRSFWCSHKKNNSSWSSLVLLNQENPGLVAQKRK